MTRFQVRGISDADVAIIDQQAEAAGQSREAYIRSLIQAAVAAEPLRTRWVLWMDVAGALRRYVATERERLNTPESSDVVIRRVIRQLEGVLQRELDEGDEDEDEE